MNIHRQMCMAQGLELTSGSIIEIAGFIMWPTLLETSMETQKGPYKDDSPFKVGLYGFPC